MKCIAEYPKVNQFVTILGRFSLSFIFLMSAFGKITDFAGNKAYMEFSGMPYPSILLIIAIIFELLGGLSILLGFKSRQGATMLIVFLFPATLIFHAFWSVPAEQQSLQMMMFTKNLAILGGLLMVWVHGTGACSLDSLCPKFGGSSCSKSN